MSDIKQEDFERLNRRRSIQQPLTIEYPKTTPILFLLITLAVLLLLWAFLGRIPTEISGNGVAMSESGTFIVSASAPGTVGTIYVNPGDEVKPGTPLGVVYNPEIKSLLVQIEAMRFKICQQEAELALLESTYATNLQLFHEGLVAKIVLDNSQSQVYEKKIAIQEAQATRDAKISELLTISPVSKNVIKNIQDQLSRNPGSMDLDAIASKLSTVVSFEKGKVLEVLVNVGDRVDRKAPLFWIEHPPETQQKEIFYSTVGADVIGRIKVGMRVLIEPVIVNPQEYGSIIGEVKTIYPYPVSKEELIQTLGNQQLAQFLIGNTPAKTLLIIQPHLNPKNVSGFEWTSAKGPPFTIPSGTISTVKIVIDEQPPISYLIPLWRIEQPIESLKGENP